LHTIEAGEVETALTPFKFDFYDLRIPAFSKADFSSSCDLALAHQDLLHEPLDFDLYYIMPHYHALGAGFRLAVLGGDDDGKVLWELGAFDAESHSKLFDPPISLHGAAGLTYTCSFDNPRSVDVGYGIGDQEMCIALGFARTRMGFEGSVPPGAATITTGEQDGVAHGVGPCKMASGEFKQDKTGGPVP
jgi:hypothetical protein